MPTIEELQAAADAAKQAVADAQAAAKPRTAGNVMHELLTKFASLLGNHPEVTALIKELQSLEPDISPAPPADASTAAAAQGTPIPLYPAAPHHAIEPKE